LNVAMLFLIFLPVATATIGWVAATATDRLRSVDLAQRSQDSTTVAKATAPHAERSKRRTTRRSLLCAAVAVVVFMSIALFFQAR
jgi:hypothetical protein